MPLSLPPGAVVRVSRGSFDPARQSGVDGMALATGDYLKPAIRKLSGLHDYYVACSPTGSFTHVSVWESDAAAEQMSRLKEMIVDARQAAEAAGVTFIPIVNYPVLWTL
jgi:hypothetical protein